MLICKVKGNVVATRKDERLTSWKILIVQPVGLKGEPQGEPFMSVDAAQAGVGDLALVARHGAAARAAMTAMRRSDEYAPANAVIIGIIDDVQDYRESFASSSAAGPAGSAESVNRGRGRPKGSKNNMSSGKGKRS